MIRQALKFFLFPLLFSGLAAADIQDAVGRAQISVEQVGASLPGGSAEDQSRAAARLVDDSPRGGAPVVHPSGRSEAKAVSLAGPVFRAEMETLSMPKAKPVAAQDGDLTPLFLSIHEQVRAGQAAPLSPGPRRVKYLFVYGLFGNHITDYMQGSVRRLRALGLESDFIGIQTEGDRLSNFEKINNAVSTREQVVLIGHSRGGVLIHDWYRSASNSSKEKVLKLVVIQAPLRGTPIADWALEHWYTRAAVALLGALPGWGDVSEAILELTTDTRRQVMAGLPPFSPADLEKVYAVYSSFEPGVNDSAHKDMLLAHGIIKGRTGEDSDGLVPVDSAQVPGARRVFLSDFDHEDSALEDAGWFKGMRGSRPSAKMSVGDFSEALVRILLQP